MPHITSAFAYLSVVTLVANAFVTPGIQQARTVCDPNASGTGLHRQRQAAIADYANLILNDKDPQTAFDRYVPGEYIQHAPAYPGDGRDVTLNYLVPFFRENQVNFSKLQTFTGDGYAFMRYVVNVPPGEASLDGDFAGVNILRFRGTCFVEHWEIIQRIAGNETNPHAFF
ncbi:hypothetical protein D9611_013392 [Ephemerocybe angulata]|uniref:SnoaL-like domain-containing protein n=1 Tax=Ephemerocybe angulata TaxID=980116 RepID=A0A8H5BUM3_9AGAR|nr:hypothetical protein D9611_013392 [Tulosesus angulatus]